jgi:cyclopropane-fatty-acyl-phospholipid synthase
MTVLREVTSTSTSINYDRWPGLRPPRSAPARAAMARQLLRQVTRRTGIRVELPDATAYGDPQGPVLQVRDADAFFTRLGRDGKICLGESFMAREWDSLRLAELFELLARNIATLVPASLQRLRRWYDASFPASEDNDLSGAKHNIARHYDLSNELFAAFLDESMTYSSALFDDFDEPLETAQERKVERLLDQAQVRDGSQVLEIGTGWGELAIRAARRGALVTTLTLSKEQAELAGKRVASAGLADRVDIRLQDYRDADGKYDAIVSVEMIEAVGEKWWPTFFRTLDERLARGGRIGLQAILLPHDRLIASKDSWTWIHKYIFPGGLIPSVQAIESTVAGHTSLKVLGRHHFGASYAETLRRWCERFDANAQLLDRLGFDDPFRRMWRFYLAYCEGGFRAGYLDVAQFLFARPGES